MIPALLELTLRGTLVFGAIWLLELALRHHMRATGRRAWWWLVGLAFILPLHLSFLPALPAPTSRLSASVAWFRGPVAAASTSAASATGASSASAGPIWLPWLWAAGVAGYLILTGGRMIRSQHAWRRARLCTDSALLELLEDCKAAAGVTAPIGLVVSTQLGSPLLLGWLRPRILLPAGLVQTSSPARLRAVLQHELAHFRACDLGLHLLFTLVRALHWFNPIAHLAAHRWQDFRELAADEAALAWLPAEDRPDYGEALLSALAHASQFSLPAGALALGESLANLKLRIHMITRHTSLAPRRLVAFAVSFALAALVTLQTARADEAADAQAAATQATKTWLAGIDAGGYAQSWTEAGALFQKSVTREKWTAALTQIRTPLGGCTERILASATLLTSLPAPGGKIEGTFVLAKYESSFEHLKAALETVTFSKEADGKWKAVGYYIKPR